MMALGHPVLLSSEDGSGYPQGVGVPGPARRHPEPTGQGRMGRVARPTSPAEPTPAKDLSIQVLPRLEGTPQRR